ncbi:hypothetical protein HCN44_006083 [Aphidius gifuensis]|uniref:Innexin n=1 Tax=Aphidius gifuensis TaxID=684658 RepID=A0A834Y491_APHGI|nr:innexin inx7-like [Aphidius gifuensis]KAF7997512.1 hypothetical protein HCN44_006083 [Aphidius gifuensis]
MATVLGTLSVLKNHIKYKVSEDFVAIDNIIFRLHYRVTFVALLLGSLLVSSRQFFGEHIKCIHEKGGVRHSAIESYCFFSSTFTVSKYMNQSLIGAGKVAAHPGIGIQSNEDDIVWHTYYQWVPFVLFFQAILFYLPHYLWKSAEGGRLKALVSKLKMTLLTMREERITVGSKTIPSISDRDEKIRILKQAFIDHIHVNKPWSYYLGAFELLNLINVIAQIYITDKFLNGQFLGIGRNTFDDIVDGEMTALDMVFPKVTKCIFHKYGASGTIEKYDALCILALNIINEKIYTLLWFWFIALSAMTFLGLVWRIATMVLHSRSKQFNRYVFSMACPGKNNPWDILKITHKNYFGDWLFLYYIAKNVDNNVFRELLVQVGHDLNDQKNNTPTSESVLISGLHNE